MMLYITGTERRWVQYCSLLLRAGECVALQMLMNYCSHHALPLPVPARTDRSCSPTTLGEPHAPHPSDVFRVAGVNHDKQQVPGYQEIRQGTNATGSA